ncbi:origin recognition complex subunit 1 [Pseudohyphozyma bogoriensis]|nr:origin recognition complex subunit 1 [Pseudohyphozyma bogoriensis]
MPSSKFVDSWPAASDPTPSGSSSLPSPTTTPTRVSRATAKEGITNDRPYPSFLRQPARGPSIQFSIGDTVLIVGAPARQKFLQPPDRLVKLKGAKGKAGKGKGKAKKRSVAEDDDDDDGIWKHDDGLDHLPKATVGIIIGLFEDVTGQMRARVRWFARPGAVWKMDGPEEGEDLLPHELYYSADSTFLQETSAYAKWKPGTPSRSTLATLKTSLSTDVISIAHITEHVHILSADEWQDSAANSPIKSFLVRKVYDAKPIEGAEFVGEIDWKEVLEKGMQRGVWDTEPVLKEEEEEEIVVKKQKRKAAPRKTQAGRKGKARADEDDEPEEASSDEENEEDDYVAGKDTDQESDGEEGEASSEEEGGDEDEDDEDDDRDPHRTPTKKRTRASRNQKPKKRQRGDQVTPRRVKPRMSKGAVQRAQKRTTKRRKFQSKQYLSSALPLPFTQSPSFKKLSVFERAKSLLHVSATPESLPCRDDQRNKIASILGDAILDHTGTCLYIHGVPGTGKTASLHSVVRELQQDEDMDPFQFVEINGMKISEPNTAFTILWEALSGQKSPPRQALAHLEEHFQTPDPTRKTTVVLVDELDQMITKKQDVIYNFFNWPHVPHSRLIVIAIANTMDLPEREMSGKIRSRLGSNRIPFPTYSWQELEAILEARLDGLDVFAPRALERIAKNVAAVSGDARRALDIARRTVEKKDQSNLINGKTELCSMVEVQETAKEMTNYGSNAFVQQASLHQKVFLLALSQCIKRAGVPEVDLETVMTWHLDFLRQTAIEPVPSHSDLFTIVSDLHGLRLLATESQRSDYFQRVRSLVENSDLFTVLRQDPALKLHVPRLIVA